VANKIVMSNAPVKRPEIDLTLGTLDRHVTRGKMEFET
jgi:hypothetical protein